jgi:hypothetical protein
VNQAITWLSLFRVIDILAAIMCIVAGLGIGIGGMYVDAQTNGYRYLKAGCTFIFIGCGFLAIFVYSFFYA